MNTIEKIASDLRQGTGNPLSAKPLFQIINAIDQVATVFLSPAHPFRQEAESRLAQTSSREMARLVLDNLFHQLTKPMLVGLLKEEIKDPFLLDAFRPRGVGHGRTRAYGPRLITHILPDNIPSIAVMSLVFALLVKSASLVKIGSEPPVLLSLFIQALQEVDTTLSESISLISWTHASMETTAKAFALSDLVILYGSGQTIETLRPLIPPQTKTIVYGPKASLGIIAREKILRKVAKAAAWDIALYDQKGCLSPHLYYVEAPLEAVGEFARWVAEALETLPLPQGPNAPEEASAIQQLRGSIPLKGGAVFASKKGVDWTVLYDPDPSFTFSPLSRTIFIKPIQDLLEIPRHLEPMRSSLQAVGIAVPPKRTAGLLDALGSLGVCRICPVGEMQKPPLTWHHEGRFRILDLLRFVDWEK